jgi:hypothetical protein
MSSHKGVVDFDLLVNQSTPFRGFGDLIKDSAKDERELNEYADQATKQIRDVFGAKLDSPATTPKELDAIAQELWETGWDPEVGNLALFTRDLGLILTDAILDSLGGRLIFRSATNLLHCSIFWDGHGLEAFPFHKAMKCLTQSAGETMTYFVRGVAHELEAKGAMRPGADERLPKAD